jgi:hypothetical protein
VSDVADLLEHRLEVAAAIVAGCDLPGKLRPALYRVVSATLHRAAARASRARLRSAERSAAIRAGIRMAIGALPTSGAWGLAGAVQRRILRKGAAFYGLARIPELATIRAELRAVDRERKQMASMSEPAISRADALSNAASDK